MLDGIPARSKESDKGLELGIPAEHPAWNYCEKKKQQLLSRKNLLKHRTKTNNEEKNIDVQKSKIRKTRIKRMSLKPLMFLFYVWFLISCYGDNKRREVKAVYDEQALRSFVYASAGSDTNKLLALLDSILDEASFDSIVFYKTVGRLEKYFSDPNSSYRNERMYERLLQHELQSRWYKDTEKKKIEDNLRLLEQNQVRKVANDFTYYTTSGLQKSLYD